MPGGGIRGISKKNEGIPGLREKSDLLVSARCPAICLAFIRDKQPYLTHHHENHQTPRTRRRCLAVRRFLLPQHRSRSGSGSRLHQVNHPDSNAPVPHQGVGRFFLPGPRLRNPGLAIAV